ncbi:hypothetical protein [Paraprevotella xylaniphila]|uniref:hypothetical protein n=1 Tax=Paraprevotella xylaniphila TaxID=454155 RepID=UPI002665EF9B|nr:hypothetical protein [Paraprevotella xylaniphila]
MKNKLLALMALCGATSSTMPLWASENWPDPVLSFTDPNLTQDETGGGVYYIYHVATQKFMNCGPWKHSDWKSELIVADRGLAVTLTWGQDYELSRHDPSASDYNAAYGWRLSTMEGYSDKNFHELYLYNGECICVDHNNQGHMLWKIMKQDDGTYRIKIADEDPLYGAESDKAQALIGIGENDFGVNPLIIPGSAESVNAGFDWKFVAEDAYEVYIAKKDLQEQLDAADAAGFTEIADYVALYNKADAKAEDVLQAVENLKSDIMDFKYSSATVTNPIPVTELISQPSFDQSTDGWVTKREGSTGNFVRKTGDKMIASDNKECENFFEYWIPSAEGNQPNWSITQELKDLPDGKYRLGAYIMTNVVPNETVSGPKGRFLMAKTLAGEVRKEADVPAVVNPDKSNGYFAPYTLEFSVIGGTATIGMVVENANSNWSAVDNFTLEYLGKAEAVTSRSLLEQNIKDAEDKYAEYKDANERFSAVGEQKYEETIKTAKEAVANTQLDDETLLGMIKAVQLRMDSLALDIAAYKTLSAKKDELEAAYDEKFPDVELGLYEDYLDELLSGYNDRTFNPNEVDSIQPRADRILKQAVLESLQEPDGLREVTSLLTNPDFSNATNGWSKTGSGDFKHDNTGVAELWNAKGSDGEVYQELNGLPSGSYKITMQGFYSPSSGNSNSWQQSWGQEGDTANDILGSLFANDASVKLHHVMDYPLTEEEKGTAERYEQITFTDDPQYKDKWLVRLKPAVAETFTKFPDRYVNEVVCYVGEDGKLRLGIKAATASVDWTGTWTVFDKFQVEYLGADDMTGAVTSLNALITQATEMLNKEVLTTQEAKDALSKAIESANAAAEGELTLEIYTEQVDALNAAIKAGNEAITAAAALETKYDTHQDKVSGTGEGSYEDYVDTEGYEELADVLVEIDDKINGEGIFASMAEIDDYNTKLDRAYSKMMSGGIDFSTASKDTPVDATNLIINPSFQKRTYDESAGEWKDERNAEGWVNASIEDASSSKVTSALNYEMFSDSSEIHQTLYNMPAGYYRVVYNGFYRAGGYIDAAVARRDNEKETLNAEVYLKGKESNWTNKLASIFDNVKEYKYDSGDVVLPDSLFPDKTELLYHCIVNGVNGAKAAFEDGAYEGNFSFRVEEGEEPVLGVRKTGKITNDWTCFDNFKLLYYGEGEANKPDDFVSSVEEAVADGKATVVSSAWYTINGVRVAEPKQRGIYIRQDKMSDGTTRSLKVMVR